MRRINLVLLLVLTALMGATPALMWLAGRWLTIVPLVDARWMEGLGALTTTVPIALAVAAIILAVHGMLLNRALADYAMEEFLELYDQAGALQPATDATSGTRAGMVVGGVAVGAAAGAGVAARSRPAADAPPPAPEAESKQSKKKDKKKGKGKKRAARSVKRAGRSVSRQGKSVARRQLRQAMPRF